METVTVGAGIIAIIKVIKENVPQVNGLVTVILALILGGVAGYLGLGGLDVQQGVIVGLGAVGTITTADRIGGK